MKRSSRIRTRGRFVKNFYGSRCEPSSRRRIAERFSKGLRMEGIR